MKEVLVFCGGEDCERKFPYRKIAFVHTIVSALRELELYKYSLVIVRIDYEQSVGIRFAEMLRNIPGYSFVPVIIVASDDRYEKWAYREIHCHEYLIMPLTEQDVIRILFSYVSLGIEEQKQENIVIRSKGKKVYVPTNEILYVMAMNRRVHIVTFQESYEVAYFALSEILHNYGKYFVQCHRSILVNRLWIDAVNYSKGYLVVKDEQLPLGRMYQETLRRAFDQV